jgi:hypothetical protein
MKKEKNQMTEKVSFPMYSYEVTRITLITDIKPVLNWRTPLPSLLGSRFWAIVYACSHTEGQK